MIQQKFKYKSIQSTLCRFTSIYITFALGITALASNQPIKTNLNKSPSNRHKFYNIGQTLAICVLAICRFVLVGLMRSGNPPTKHKQQSIAGRDPASIVFVLGGLRVKVN